MRELGIYIHIPFCKKKCYYCDFVSFVKSKEIQKRYINALIMEIKCFLENNKNNKINTIYIGGGTPSYIDSSYIIEILELFNITNQTEVTIEVNPGTIDSKKLEDYKKAKINRLSIGLQSTDNKLLKEIGRIHNYQDFLNTYFIAKTVGFKNINVDLMLGLPNQKIEDLKESLNKVIELNPTHISVYSLILEEGTKLYKQVQNKELTMLNEEIERNMYWYTKNILELNGYSHYEISNFCKEGYNSKHNIDCWEQKQYIGFGLAAHSYIDNIRFSNNENLNEYIKNIEEKNYENNRIIHEVQDNYMKQQEYMILGLRKIEGVSINNFKNKFGENPLFVFRKELNKLVEGNLLSVDMDKIHLTNKGLDLANKVFEEFV